MSSNRRRRSWLRRWLRVPGWILVALVLLVVLGRAWLAGPWGRNWLAGRIEERLGLPASIDALSWSPGSGVELRGLRVEQPESLRAVADRPLLEVGLIRVWPEYRRLFSSGGRVAGVEIEDPRVALAAEMLASMAAEAMKSVPPVATEPPVVMTTPEVESPEPAGEGVPAAGGPAAGGGERSPQREAPATPAGPDVEAAPARWMTVRGGSLDLGGLGARVLTVRGIDAELPWGGGPAAGRLRVASLALGDEEPGVGLGGAFRTAPSGVEIALHSEPENPTQVAGVLKLGIRSHVPFQIRIGVARDGAVALAGPDGWRLGCERFTLRAALAGWLGVPASWQGQGDWVAAKPAVQLGGMQQGFDDARLSFGLAAGRLSVPELRAGSPELSLLGNGRLAGSGGAAVMRVVIPPEQAGPVAAWVAERTGGARLRFRPFDPPDRWYADLEASTLPGGWHVELGEGGSLWPLPALLDAMLGGGLEDLRAGSMPAIPER